VDPLCPKNLNSLKKKEAFFQPITIFKDVSLTWLVKFTNTLYKNNRNVFKNPKSTKNYIIRLNGKSKRVGSQQLWLFHFSKIAAIADLLTPFFCESVLFSEIFINVLFKRR